MRGVDVKHMHIILCQQTSPKHWCGKMERTSNYDVTNSAHHIQM